MRPGTDFPTRLESLLSHTDVQWCDDDAEEIEEADFVDDDDAKSDWSGFPRRVTVKDVLKYSRTLVITPSVTVQTCTQEFERSRSQPSARTVDSKAVIEWGTKTNESSEEAPVRRRIINWWDGGPWNHHSRSGARIWWTVSTSRVLKASYRARTTLWLASPSSRVFCALASSVTSPPGLESSWEVKENRERRKVWRDKERENASTIMNIYPAKHEKLSQAYAS